MGFGTWEAVMAKCLASSSYAGVDTSLEGPAKALAVAVVTASMVLAGWAFVSCGASATAVSTAAGVESVRLHRNSLTRLRRRVLGGTTRTAV